MILFDVTLLSGHKTGHQSHQCWLRSAISQILFFFFFLHSYMMSLCLLSLRIPAKKDPEGSPWLALFGECWHPEISLP